MPAISKPVCVKLKMEWMGHPKGTVLNLPKRMADSLYKRDAASMVTPEVKPQEKTRRRA